MKTCGYCYQEIHDDATKCNHCQSFLTIKAGKKARKDQRSGLITFLVVLAIIALLIMLIGV